MPHLTVAGKEIQGVIEAHVEIFHRNPNAPDPVPTMQFKVKLRLQYEDQLPLLALAKQSPQRFAKVELKIFHREATVAHTWTIPNAFIAFYDETEHPGTDVAGSSEGGYFTDITFRGHMPESKDYDGTNVMTCKAGEPPKTAS
jgi:hypothetical protein